MSEPNNFLDKFFEEIDGQTCNWQSLSEFIDQQWWKYYKQIPPDVRANEFYIIGIAAKYINKIGKDLFFIKIPERQLELF